MSSCKLFLNIKSNKKISVEQRTDLKLFLERVTMLGVQPGDSSDIADGLSGHVHHRLRLTSDSSDFVQHCIT